MASTTGQLRAIPYPREDAESSLQESQQGLLERFKPTVKEATVTQQARGIFIPYPLLAIITPLLVVLIGGIIGLCTMVYSMNTSMLMRDNDWRQQVHDLQEKNAQLEVYIHNDRERLAKLEAEKGKNQ